MTPPNLAAHQPTGNGASGDDHRPYMPAACQCGTLDQSKGEGGYHRSIDPLEIGAVQNVLVPLVGFHHAGPSSDDKTEKYNCSDDHVFNPSEKILRGLTGHSGRRNAGFSRAAISLVRAATFLLLHDRLELPCGNSPAGLIDAPSPATKARQRAGRGFALLRASACGPVLP